MKQLVSFELFKQLFNIIIFGLEQVAFWKEIK